MHVIIKSSLELQNQALRKYETVSLLKTPYKIFCLFSKSFPAFIGEISNVKYLLSILTEIKNCKYSEILARNYFTCEVLFSST